MIRKRLVSLFVTLALLLAAIGASGIVADSLGVAFTPAAFACQHGGGTGGGC